MWVKKNPSSHRSIQMMGLTLRTFPKFFAVIKTLPCKHAVCNTADGIQEETNEILQLALNKHFENY